MSTSAATAASSALAAHSALYASIAAQLQQHSGSLHPIDLF